MSGHKKTTVTISTAEYQRLREAQLAKRFEEKENSEILKSIRNDTQKALNAYVQQMNARQSGFDEMVGHISGSISDFANETSSSQKEYNKKIEKRIADLSAELETGIQDSLEANLSLFDEILKGETDRQALQAAEIEKRLGGLETSQIQKFEFAANWGSEATGVLDFIGQSYSNLFDQVPALEKAENELRIAQGNLDLGFTDAALTQFQKLVAELSEIRIKIEKQDLEWNWLFQSVKEKAAMLHQMTVRQKIVQAIDLEGKSLPFSIETDYWSDGRYAELLDYVEQLNEQISSPAVYLETGVLKDLLQNTIPQLEMELEKIILDVRFKVLQSQIRMNIADLVVQAFSDQGYQIQAASYDDKDPRRSFQAKMNHICGSEVVIKVDPAFEDDLRNELHLFSLDHERLTAHELHQRAKEIRQSLQSHGLQLGATSTQPMIPIPAVPVGNALPKDKIHELRHEQAHQ